MRWKKSFPTGNQIEKKHTMKPKPIVAVPALLALSN
jgi:hypothetical protein